MPAISQAVRALHAAGAWQPVAGSCSARAVTTSKSTGWSAGGVVPAAQLASARRVRVVPRPGSVSPAWGSGDHRLLGGDRAVAGRCSATGRGGEGADNYGQSCHSAVHADRRRWPWADAPPLLLSLALPAVPFLPSLGAGGFLGSGFDISGPESVVQALGLLALIVAVHEAGHFAAARLQGIHVTRFSVGFGPVLVKYQGPKVEYALRAIPLGGYVAFPDEDPESEFDEEDPDLLSNRPLLDRVIVISAGVIANFIFAYTILFTQVSTVGSSGTPEYLPGIKVPEVVRGSMAERSGFKSGDLIELVDGAPVLSEPKGVTQLVDQIRRSDGRAMKFQIVRDGTPSEITAVPELADDGYGRLGMQLINNYKVRREKPSSIASSAAMAGREWVTMTKNTAGGLAKIVSNFEQESKEVSGPVAIVAVGAQVARNDSTGLFQFAALVNINLAVVNLVPFPGLDGGYLALASLEAARGEKLDKEVEGAIQGSGVLLLLGTGIFLILKDALSLFK